MLATVESLIGSVWGAGFALVIGYIGGHLIPISKIAEWIPGNKK